MRYADRAEAGRRLAARLRRLRGEDAVVLGLPRGGVPVAAEVARGIGADLDVVVVRKLGVPQQPELAMGAVGEGGVLVLDDAVARRAGVPAEDVAAAVERERETVRQRAASLRGARPPAPVAGRTAVLVDDGAATGATARAACEVVRGLRPARVVVAVPVAAPEALRRLQQAADDVVCLQVPEGFSAVGQWYRDFAQVPDDTVLRLLRAGSSSGSGR